MRWRILILVMILPLISLGSATREYMNSGNYNVSFDYSKPHEALNLNLPHSIYDDACVRVRTFDGPVTITTINSSYMSLFDDTITIDNQTADFHVSFNGDRKLDDYIATYPLGNKSVRILSTLPVEDTVAFMKSVQVRQIKK